MVAPASGVSTTASRTISCLCAQFLGDADVFESAADAKRREEALARLRAIAQMWVPHAALASGLPQYVADTMRVSVHASGLWRLGAQAPGACRGRVAQAQAWARSRVEGAHYTGVRRWMAAPSSTPCTAVGCYGAFFHGAGSVSDVLCVVPPFATSDYFFGAKPYCFEKMIDVSRHTLKHSRRKCLQPAAASKCRRESAPRRQARASDDPLIVTLALQDTLGMSVISSDPHAFLPVIRVTVRVC